MSQDGNDFKPMAEILFDAVRKKLLEVNTSMPCFIVSYNSSKNLATVKPALKRKYRNSEPIELPTISNVPVIFPQMGDAHLALPVVPNQEGLLIFSQRSIDKWLVSGGVVDPEDRRSFSLSDAVFIPGLTSSSNTIKRNGAPTSTEVANGGTYLELLSSGKIKLTNGTDEVIDLLSQTAEQLLKAVTELAENHTVTISTLDVPTPPDNVAAYTALKSSVDTLKAAIDAMKG